MKKDRLYLYTFLALSALFLLIGSVTAKYFISLSSEKMLATLVASSNRETREVALLLGELFKDGKPKDSIQLTVQKMIKDSYNDGGYLSVINWSSERIAHPDVTLVGTKLETLGDEGFNMNQTVSIDELYQGILDADGTREEIIALRPVSSSDWMVSSHANIKAIQAQIANTRNRFYALFSIMGLAIILCSVIMVRFIGSSYEKQLERKNDELETEVLNLAKLNTAIDAYQKRIIEEKPVEKAAAVLEDGEDQKETNKKRILTYLRNELLSVSVDDIAYIYTENTITYIVDRTGKRSTSNSSLDEIYSGLDGNFFYRANRQFIIAIEAINKIIKYGNNQLKILVEPSPDLDIIIGKNKAAEFKQWLNN